MAERSVPPLDLPARRIPPPSSISPQAQQVLVADPNGAVAYPPPEDTDAWTALRSTVDGMLVSMLEGRAVGFDCEHEVRRIGGADVNVVVPATLEASREERVVLDVHGGALVLGGGAACAAMARASARRHRTTVWAPDYRMPPACPFPAALDDCLDAYRALLEEHRPASIIVSGASAGGNLAAALLLRARDEGLPMPAACILLTPEVDLTESGDSFQTLLGIDTVLAGSLMGANLLYADGADLAHPYVSPLFGDFSKGFPRTFLQSGTRDLFLSNTVRLHRALRAAGVAAELHVFEAMPHGGFFGAPEDEELEAEIRRFVASVWNEP